ncbi:uncharacterized protein LOC141800601 [Halichoeres trimaculatus]|uniref:uncharacterized protein LOC141800601 n=1 Tax=Halichoeres trimaculatus TaxID=147232 RepID=UPI003D9DEFB1
MYNLTKDRDALKDEREALKHEKEALEEEHDQLKTHHSNLSGERDTLRNGQEALRNEGNALKKELQALKAEQDGLKTNYSSMTQNRDFLRDERDVLITKLGSMQDERDHLKNLSLTLTKDINALSDERDAVRDERDQAKAYSSSLTKEKQTLREERDALRGERDQLKSQFSILKRNMDALQNQYNNVTASRNQLQQEVNNLRVQLTAKTCHHGWTRFNDKCYYFSPSEVKKTWDESRQDCQSRGGDLAKPKARVELTFVSRSNTFTWIGLSDRLQEGKWKWVDGTDLKSQGFWKQGEPNNANSNEDCAEVAKDEGKLNDVPCSAKFPWVLSNECQSVLEEIGSSAAIPEGQMSSTFSRRSGEFGGDTRYLMTIDDGSKSGRRSPSSVWWIGTSVVCLVLLLLSVILVAQNTSAINRWDTKYENLIRNLTTTRDKPDEPDQQKLRSSSLTQDRDALKEERDSVRKELEALMEERQALKSERHQLGNYSGDLLKDRNALKDEREALRNERATLKDERDQLKIFFSNLTRLKVVHKEDPIQKQDACRDEREALTAQLDLLKLQTLNLTTGRDTMRDEMDGIIRERDSLKMRNKNLSESLNDLRAQYNRVLGQRDRFQEEINILSANQTGKVCLSGWTLFNNKCYFFSRGGLSKSWEESQADCQSRGGDLAMPKTKAELTFVSKGNTYTWIGLTDKAHEGKWQWVDGTDLENTGFWKKGEPNNTGNEDCAEVSRSEVKLNDAPCSNEFSWACEI